MADVDGTGPVEAIAGTTRGSSLYAFVGCSIEPVLNAQGATYSFDYGLRGTGTGVGCVDTGTGPHLVGLNVTADDGTTVHWTRTEVDIDGLAARNGATTEGTFVRPADAAAIDLLHQTTCGDLTVAADGLTLGS